MLNVMFRSNILIPPLPGCLFYLVFIDAVVNGGLVSNPPAVDGVLHFVSGKTVSLTCDHNNVIASVTLWCLKRPFNDAVCSSIHHQLPVDSVKVPNIGPFTLQPNFTRLGDGNLTSTIAGPVNVSMNGTTIECLAGNTVNNFSTGNITLHLDEDGELWIYMPNTQTKQNLGYIWYQLP